MTARKKDVIPDTVASEIRKKVAELNESGASRGDLSRAVATLLFFEHDIYPSTSVVREFTRLGSLTDVGADLRHFWATIREKSRVRIEAPNYPQDVLDLFSEALAKVWDLTQAKAAEQLEEFRLEIAGKLQDAELRLQDAEGRSTEAREREQTALQQAATANETREATEKQLAVVQSEKEAALALAAQWEAQAKAESESRLAAEERFSNETEKLREESNKNKEYFEGELRFVKVQIDSSRAAERDLREQLKAAKTDSDLMEARMRQANNGLREENGRLQLEIGELRGRLAAVTEDRARLQENLETMSASIYARATAAEQESKRMLEALRSELVTRPFAFEVKEMLDCELVMMETGTCLVVNRGGEQVPITPPFPTLEEMDGYCEKHIEAYQEMSQDTARIP